MGTRAIVRYNFDNGMVENKLLVTHHDGNPESLGSDLVQLIKKSKGRNDNIYSFSSNIEKTAHDFQVDQEFFVKDDDYPEKFRDIFDSENHDVHYEYEVYRVGRDDITEAASEESNDWRVRYRRVYDDTIPEKEEGWKDVATALGMNYQPYSVYSMSKGRDGEWKVKKFGNDRASVSEEDPQDAWDRGKELVENNAPATIYYTDKENDQTRTYTIDSTPSKKPTY